MKKRLLSKPINLLCKLFPFLGVLLLLNINFVNGQLITNVTATTGHPYAVSVINPGDNIYTDRSYITTALPSYLTNVAFIKTPNDDKASKSSITFKLSQTAYVYIGYDPRATSLPAWLNSWQKLPDSINITDPKITKFDIYRKSFSAGTVTIGGNIASPAANVLNMSIILATPNSVSAQPPVVSLTKPAQDTTYNTVPATVNLAASATAFNGSISKVEFFRGSTLVKTEVTDPYRATLTKVAAGTYVFTAKATDNNGLSTTSSPVTITVTKGNVAPTVSVKSPANNASFIAPASITITANAADADGSVSKVEFYNGVNLLGFDNNSPYSYAWNNVAVGNYSITARATDNLGQYTISTPVSIVVANSTVIPPAVSISKPSTDTTYTSAPATIDITATANAYNASVTKVEFFNGTSLIKSDNSFPYSCSISNAAVGSYPISAKVTDSKGSTTTSAKVIISVVSHTNPSVISVTPANGATNVEQDASVSTNAINLPNGGINNNTITSANVFLTENVSGALVASNVNGTGGGDAITLVPSAALKKSTVYKFHITAGVKDLSGTSFVPYTSTFTTNSNSTGLTTIQFEKVTLPTTTGRHTCVTVGPDGKLYALVDNGLIQRFTINANGTLSAPELIYSLQDSYGTRQKTLAICLVFDPSSTAGNLIAWVTHCNTYVFTNAPDWDDRLTKLSGNNLQVVKDVLINLPRSAKDHVTNSAAFGPDGALYFTQGASCAMGQADQTWNFRNEHLLSAAVLRLDLSKLPGTLPLDVKTSDGGGTYNPYAANAPLTIYASGIRNSYDLVWHTNGNLYVATNGSAAGGNTPSSVPGTKRPDGTSYNGPAITGLNNVQQTQEDFLYRIVKGGYYGHPNPTRGEYVMNGGNPTSAKDSAEVVAYPVGTFPDANWRGNIYNFKNNISPNGFLEYKNNAFNGALKGKLLVVRYSAHDDIITLTPGSNNNIVSAVQGISTPGFTGFIDPLDITEDVRNGNIYVSEYGGDSGKVTLLRPTSVSMRSSAQSSDTYVSNNATPINTVAGCDAGIAVLIAEEVNTPLLTIKKPRISPNPIRQKFTIQFPNSYGGKYTLQIVDISGRKYQIGQINLQGGTNMGIDISSLSLKAGTYFLKLSAENKKAEVFKLVIVGN